jgi:hypothetical protein
VRPTIAVLAFVLAATAVACVGHRRATGDPSRSTERYGVYRARLVERGETARRAKLLLFVAPPDRIHAEVLPPVGGAALILDGGQGRLAVTVSSRNASWVGEARPDVLETILGFPLTLEALVGSLLEGTPLDGPVALSRLPRAGAGLPRSFSLAHAGRELTLELQRTRKRGRGVYPIGTGSPPPGGEVLPLEELVAEGGPFLFEEE